MSKEANEQLGESRERVEQFGHRRGCPPVSPPNELTAVVRRSYSVKLGCEGHSLQLRWRRGTQPAAAMAARDTACSCGMGRRQGICVAAAQMRQWAGWQ